MTVNVEWKTAGGGHTGLVADGTCLLDAARRHGVELPTECGGRGECDTCAVVVEEGATLLSGLTEAERTRLSPERLAAGERLACQAKVERGGDLVLRPVPVTERAETTEEAAKDLRAEFRRMPLRKKLAALAGMEADVAYETLLLVADVPFAVFGKGLDLLASRGRKLSQAERKSQHPSEHAPTTAGDKGPEEQPG